MPEIIFPRTQHKLLSFDNEKPSVGEIINNEIRHDNGSSNQEQGDYARVIRTKLVCDNDLMHDSTSRTEELTTASDSNSDVVEVARFDINETKHVTRIDYDDEISFCSTDALMDFSDFEEPDAGNDSKVRFGSITLREYPFVIGPNTHSDDYSSRELSWEYINEISFQGPDDYAFYTRHRQAYEL